ncbi:hypothetical protein FIE12Z_6293 [Fusarium flagelliforme]|uniref:NACHT domain-containing protein n=1 Tax=Fusarium flagelliforme TaxID=2675880 RepID=A0A395MN77_9HYPO|nr:hypothetical protein FIE12Z_6293 [Fusarium flagelliforme]
MSDENPPHSPSPEGSDIVVIGKDDTSNYNPDNFLPQSEATIASIREWLRPTEYDHESGEYHKQLAFHLEGTGEWLHHSQNYQRWRESSEDGLLWIKGVPGSGKSVVAANMIHKLSQEEVPVLYFFFRQIIDANHRPINLLRDWLDQILPYSPPLQSTLKGYIDDARLLEKVSIEELWRHLKTALASLPLIYGVVDALDEMDDGNSDFITQLAELGHLRPSSVKVLLTSRPTANVETAMRHVKSLDVRMEEKLVDVDIATYVRFCLGETSISEGDQRLIRDAVPGRANGLFLYAKLAMKAFLEPGVNIQDTIHKLPLDLNAMYIGILQEHARRSGIAEKTQVMILQWVTHATRPLRLLELADILGTAIEGRDKHTLKANKDLVRAACGPLLEVLPDETVSVVHHSLTEFLIGTTRAQEPGDYPILESAVTHYDLALICLDYIFSECLRDRQVSFYSCELERSRINIDFPFAEYAISNWHVHTRRCKWNSSPEDALLKQTNRLMSDIDTRNTLLKLSLNTGFGHRSDDYHIASLSDLHLAALCGLEPVMKTIIERLGLSGEMLDIQDSLKRTPLWWTACNGHAGAARLLLQHGASHIVPDVSEFRPIHTAVMNDRHEVVRLLMEEGIAPTLKWSLDISLGDSTDKLTDLKDTLIGSASAKGYLKSLEAMLPFCRTADKKYALFAAIDAEQSHVVKRLVCESDFDVNETFLDQTPLFLAANRCSIEVMEILINAGADARQKCKTDSGAVNKKNAWSTVLVEFCHARCDYLTREYDSHFLATDLNLSNFKRMLELLIDAGADLNERDSMGRSAIHSAGNSETLKYLLGAGADPTAKLRDGRTVLHCLPQNADKRYLELLVEVLNAGINGREHLKGRTSLLSAIRSQSDLAVPMLRYGSDCTLTDFEGNGPLHYALFNYLGPGIPQRMLDGCLLSLKDISELPKLLRALLEAGADPKLVNHDGETPLHVLAGVSYVMAEDLEYLQEAIQLFLHQGANIEARDAKGQTPLFRLARRPFRSHEEVTALFGSFTKASANLDVRDTEGRTLLHEAIYHISRAANLDGSITFSYQYLVDAGVSPLTTDFKGNTLCHELILAPGCRREKDLSKVFLTLFEKAGVETNKSNFSGITPLHLICQMPTGGEYDVNRKTQDCLKWLLKHSSDPNASDIRGLRPIHFAASTDSYTVDRLLRAGADPFAITQQGMNALHIASRCKRSNNIGLLLQWMSDLSPEARNTALNQKDVCQHTPLHYACRSGRIESVRLLLEAGADVNPTFDITKEAHLDEPWLPPILQCAFFRSEHALWKRGPLEIILSNAMNPDPSVNPVDAARGSNLIAGGYTVEDTKRPFGKAVTELELKTFDPELVISRFEGIIDDLISAGAVVNQVGHDSMPVLYRAMLFAAEKLDYYATSLLWEISEKFTKVELPTPTDISIRLIKAHRQAEIAVMRDFFLPQAKATTWETVARLLSDRQYSLIEELYKAGADFTARSNDACMRSTSNMEVMRFLVEKKGANVNARDPDGLTALHWLAGGQYWWHHAQAIPYLLSKGADLEARSDGGHTPLLHSSARWGAFRATAMKVLIDYGADVNTVGDNGVGCLSYAALNETLVQLLVDHGAEVSPMSILNAIQHRQAEVLRILLSSNEQPGMAKSWRLTLEDAKQMKLDANPLKFKLIREGHPLVTASTTSTSISEVHEKGESFVPGEMMGVLLAAGISPYDTYMFWAPEIWLSARSTLPMAIATRTWDKKESDSELIINLQMTYHLEEPRLAERVVIHEIFSDGLGFYQPILELPSLDLELRDKSGNTLLLAACRRGFSKAGRENHILLKQILEKGADPFAVDNYGRNAMHHMLGSAAPNDEKLDSIKEFRANILRLINQADAEGYFPLHYGLAALVRGEGRACSEPEWIDYIISQGANMLVVDAFGNNALHYLVSGLFGPLCENGAGTKEIFKKFLDMGLDINARNNGGQTPMFFLATTPERGTFEEIMNWADGLGVDWRAMDEQKRNILHEIADEPVGLFKAVMNRGADPLAEDVNGRTSLDLAAAHDNEEVLGLFNRDGKE